MFKRLSISLLLMGLAAFGLGAAAFAWFSTSETGDVSITSGSADIAIDVDIDCKFDGIDATIDGGPDNFPFEWFNIVPGDVSQDCFTVRNTGDGPLDLFVQHGTATGALASVLDFTYDQNVDPADGDICGPGLAGAGGFTTANGNKGCKLGEVGPSGQLFFVARVEFPWTNSDQNGSSDRVLNMEAVVTGYTSQP